jgi:DNA modification methylase
MSVSDSTIVSLLSSGRTYEEVARRTGRSRGSIWRVARDKGARKNEPRIRARAADRIAQTERLALLEARVADMGTTKSMDVLDFLRETPANSVQIVCTSPPYNVGVDYGGGARADRVRHLAYLGLMLQVVSELERVTAPGGIVALQVGSTKCDDGTLKPLDVVLWDYLVMAGLSPQSRVVWPSVHGLTPKSRLAERYETVLIFSKGEPSVFNPSVARRPQKHPGKRAFRGPRRGALSGHPLGSFPTNVWDDIPHVAHNREHHGHPAAFSQALARRIIGLYSLPGQTIADCFSGSGTTQIAAFAMGRAFIGCDLYYEGVRTDRLADATPDRFSRLPGVTTESAALWEAEARRVAFDAQLSFAIDTQTERSA